MIVPVNLSLKIGIPQGIHYEIQPEKYSVAILITKDGLDRIRFHIGVGYLYVGTLVMIALLLASPLDKKQLAIRLPVSVVALFTYHAIILDIGARYPIPVIGQAITPLEIQFLEAYGPVARGVFTGLIVFNMTVGWELVPIVIWAAAAWRKWA